MDWLALSLSLLLSVGGGAFVSSDGYSALAASGARDLRQSDGTSGIPPRGQVQSSDGTSGIPPKEQAPLTDGTSGIPPR